MLRHRMWVWKKTVSLMVSDHDLGLKNSLVFFRKTTLLQSYLCLLEGGNLVLKVAFGCRLGTYLEKLKRNILITYVCIKLPKYTWYEQMIFFFTRILFFKTVYRNFEINIPICHKYMCAIVWKKYPLINSIKPFP